MAYEIDMEEGNSELAKAIIKKIQIYERDCMKKNEQSSQAKIRKIVEDMCNENKKN